MAFNGSGVFNRLYSWVNDAASGIKIRADRMDNEMNGFATGLSNCVTKDGQTTVTADLPMAGFRHTGVGAATSRTQYATFAQVQDGNSAWADAGGTADAITASYSVAITALVDGQLCFVRASAANTTATPTFSPNGLTARTIVKNGGAALAIGDIAGNGHELILRYDLVGTRWELLNPRQPIVPNIPYTFASAAGPSTLDFFEDTDNGTNKLTLRGPTSLGSDATLQLPSTGTLATLAGTEAFTNKTVNGVTLSTSAGAANYLAGDGTYKAIGITNGTAVAASGTFVEFTGIPSTARRISIMLGGISTNGTANYLVQIGNGSVETTGYVSSAEYGGVGVTSTAGYIIRNGGAATNTAGILTIQLINTNRYVASGMLRDTVTGTGGGGGSAGDKATSAAIDRVRITTVGGTDTFDNGTINISWE